jgi:class I fructose-bisphosphate aldolase/fructose-bisphosphate aldolase/2-amino-3,7-dideoxy-D-threo-hept-6-ulosonate synthase
VVAFGHGLSLGAPSGFKTPEMTIEEVLRGSPDRVLVGPHFACHYRDRLRGANVDVVLIADVVKWSISLGQDHGEDLRTLAFGP